MNPIVTSTLVLGCLAVAILLGRTVRSHIPEHHLSGDSKDAVKVAMGLVATMTALLLGLLVRSAKGTYDIQRNEVIQIAGKITFADRLLLLFGGEAAAARVQFRLSVEDAVLRMWPCHPDRPADLAPKVANGDAFYVALQQLAPRTELQRDLKTQLVRLVMDLGQIRTLLLAQSVPSVATPVLIMVVTWLAIIFLTFSLLSPPNVTTMLALMVSALAVAGAIYLILELDRPFGGMIQISPTPMRNALIALRQGGQ